MRNPHSPAPDPAYDYWKYHGLGNDYLVLHPRRFRAPLSAAQARALCDRHRGPGADGVLWGPLPAQGFAGAAAGSVADGVADGAAKGATNGAHGVRIYNPDGSEAEKSGNGVRIFARFLWEQGAVPASPFDIATAGGPVRARVLTPDGGRIALGMGPVSFRSERIPMSGAAREVLREPLQAAGMAWSICAANVGNPHCVVLVEAPTPELAQRVGPHIEHHASFPQRTNVQFVQLLSRHAIRIEIWERGAGYTQASGTSSCAAAAVACRLGLCESPVTVHMPGGTLEVRLDGAWQAELEGPVEAVTEGLLASDFRSAWKLERA